jgi:hopanoid-associated phosphorylase
MTVIAVTGLAKEARIARRAGAVPVIGGGDAALLARRLEEAIAKGANGIVSFGIAGALAPLLKAGDIVVATHVVFEVERYATDTRWSAAIRAKLPNAKPVILAGSGEIVSHTGAKKRLFGASGAHGVDMESHIAARIAKSHGIPFVAIRAISDAAHRALPSAALVPLKPNGRVRLSRILVSVAREPLQIGELMTTGRDAGRAFASLLGCLDALGPGLGCPYLG